MSGLGITNILTTNASSAYARLALEQGGLVCQFATIFDRQQVMAWEGKKYREVNKKYQLGWWPERYMLVIGDSSKDMPCDMKGIPFILDATNPSPPTALEYLIQELCTKKTTLQLLFVTFIARGKKWAATGLCMRLMGKNALLAMPDLGFLPTEYERSQSSSCRKKTLLDFAELHTHDPCFFS
jgi:hypothetical protein